MIDRHAARPDITPPGDPQSPLLAEQLINFANEAFVFADASRLGLSARPESAPPRFAPPSPSYFADVEPPPLAQFHLQNTRVVPSREQLLPLLPKGGVCLEIGTETGAFGRQILSVLAPAKLHLCDRDFNYFDDAPFAKAIQEGIVELHEGEASEHLAAQPDRHFDLIYFRAGQSYVSSARALEQAGRKIKEDGCIICSNYSAYAPLEGVKSGVARAVNEFCHAGGFEIAYLALHPLGLQDAGLRKCASAPCAGHLGGASLEAPDPNTFLPEVWEYLIDKYQIASVLDVGAGAGWSTKWFAQRGIYTLGVEGWREALEKSQCRSNIVEHDYSSGPFIPSMLLDLAWCAGFVEQIEEDFIPNFMASFRSCQYVCLTHAEAGHHHAIGRPADYWIQKMNEFGFDYDAAETACLRSADKHKSPHGRRTLSFFKRRN